MTREEAIAKARELEGALRTAGHRLDEFALGALMDRVGPDVAILWTREDARVAMAGGRRSVPFRQRHIPLIDGPLSGATVLLWDGEPRELWRDDLKVAPVSGEYSGGRLVIRRGHEQFMYAVDVEFKGQGWRALVV